MGFFLYRRTYEVLLVETTLFKMELRSKKVVNKSQKKKGFCSICQDEILDDEWKSACEHQFHKSCVFDWLLKSHKRGLVTCPICRRILDPEARYCHRVFDCPDLRMKECRDTTKVLDYNGSQYCIYCIIDLLCEENVDFKNVQITVNHS